MSVIDLSPMYSPSLVYNCIKKKEEKYTCRSDLMCCTGGIKNEMQLVREISGLICRRKTILYWVLNEM